MSDSILISIKKTLGLDEEYTAFDPDIIMHINSVFATLNQLGVGPAGGFEIDGVEPTWADYLEDDTRFNDVKTYMYLRVRLLFDPPTTSYSINAFDEQRKELEWRISARREENEWVPPADVIVLDS